MEINVHRLPAWPFWIIILDHKKHLWSNRIGRPLSSGMQSNPVCMVPVNYCMSELRAVISLSGVIQWIGCPGQGCRDGLLSSASGCSSTTAQTYLTCSAVWGGAVGAALPLCFLNYFFKGFSIFIVRQYQAHFTADSLVTLVLTVAPELHLYFQHLHCCKRKFYPVPSTPAASSCVCLCCCGHLCDCTGGWAGHMTLLGVQKASVNLSQVEKSSFCQDSWLILPCWNWSLGMLHQHSRIIFN